MNNQIHKQIIKQYTRYDCVNSCKIANNPMNNCGVSTTNPIDLTFNEDIRGAYCIANSKKNTQKCIDNCDAIFNRNK